MLELAIGTIAAALRTGRRRIPDDYPDFLASPGASFVTLRRHGQLLGCIGALEPYQDLGPDIACHALAAAFDDPRFPPVDSLQDVHAEISVLGPLEPFPAQSYDDVVARLPRCGAVVEAQGRRGTFLPAVWEQLPQPRDFVAALWRKAGLRPGTWPATLWTYDVEEFGTDVG
jgi:AmmeMemoRadiSam system protein A